MTPNDALAYVQGKIADIRALPNKLVRQRQQLALIRDAARAAGQVTTAQGAQTRLDEAMTDLQSAQTMNTRLDGVVDAYESVRQAVGLGVLPVVPIAAGVILVTVAISATYLFGKADTREASIAKLVLALSNGELTPEQLRKLLEALKGTGTGTSIGGLLGDAKNLLLLGIGAVVVMTVLKYAPTRRTA